MEINKLQLQATLSRTWVANIPPPSLTGSSSEDRKSTLLISPTTRVRGHRERGCPSTQLAECKQNPDQNLDPLE